MSSAVDAPAPTPTVPPSPASPRLQRLFAEHYDFVWRLLRRWGVPEADTDDAAQHVFMILSRKLEIVREGSEKSFLYGTALKVSANVRRSERVRASRPPQEQLAGSSYGPDDLADRAKARALLDELLRLLPDELRRVLVLAEIEQQSLDEIASLEGIPSGTAASRLRRARKTFRDLLARNRARNPFAGDGE